MPHADQAIIEALKIVHYLLDVDHPDSGSKARLLVSLGYSAAQWKQLDDDLRSTHLTDDYVTTRNTA